MTSWVVEYDDAAIKQMKKIDANAQQRIRTYLAEKIHMSDNPRRFGKMLVGDKLGLWRYRIGDYRVICSLQDYRLTVLVVAVGHRGKVYR